VDTTVVMITLNRRASALRAVAALRALPERPPVVVVDNGSDDGSAEALETVDGVRVIRAGRNLGASGRTVGVEAAATPFVAFADDDSAWAPGALARAEGYLARHPRLALLTARTLVGPERRDDPINALLAAAPAGVEPDLPGPTVVGFLACAAVVRRTAYLQVGGFHPRYGVGGEEHLLALDLLAAGWGSCYLADVLAYHDPEPHPTRAGRSARQLRNDLWTTWLRRRPAVALRATLAVLRRTGTDAGARRALLQAVAGSPWIVRERRPLPAPLEELVAQTDVPLLGRPAPAG
jgi:GT2 family glycosyltransferase